MTTQRYRDINPSFIAHPVTGDVATFNEEASVRFSVRNLISTNFAERQYNHALGSNVTGLLFDLNDPAIGLSLERAVKEVLNNYEPRVDVLKVTTLQTLNDLVLRINYRIRATGINSSLEVSLKRLR